MGKRMVEEMEEEDSDDVVEVKRKKMKRGDVREMVNNRVKKEEMLMLESEEEEGGENGIKEIFHSDKNGKYKAEKEEKEDEGVQEVQESSKGVRYIWRSEKGLPPGWMVRKTGFEKEFLKGPDSTEHFNGRKQALVHMIFSGYPEEDKAKMRESMKAQGWNSSEKLPSGWIFRVRNRTGRYVNGRRVVENSAVFLSPEGAFFKSTKNAIGFLETSTTYTNEDVCKLQGLMADMSNEGRTKSSCWEESVELPKGWRIKRRGDTGIDLFMAPNGQSFMGGCNAVKFLATNIFPEDAIHTMRKYLVDNCGWSFSPQLPEGWMLRDTSKGQQSRVWFLSDKGHKTESYKEAMELMRLECTAADVAKLQQMIDTKMEARRLSSNAWREEPGLPRGWKMRDMGEERRYREYFLAPDGKQLIGAMATLQHMVADKSGEVVEEMREFMVLKGWQRSENLPPGWIFRDRHVRGGVVTIITEEGKVFESYLKAKEHLELQGDNKGVIKIDMLIQENSRLRRLKSINKDEIDGNLPKGWKMRKVNHIEYFVLPDGQEIRGLVQAFQHIVKAGSSEELLDTMRSFMVANGWKKSVNLPHGWILKARVKHGDHMSILSRDGILFTSFLGLKEFMLKESFDQEDIDRVDLLTEEMLRKRRLNNPSQSLPMGWTTNTIGSKQLFIDLEGRQFLSSRLALKEMWSRGLPDEDLAMTREVLKQNEWKTSKHLPKDWMYKEKSGSIRYLKENGDLLNGGVEAWIVMNNEKSTEEIEAFRVFLEKQKVDTRVKNSSWNKDDPTIPAGWSSKFGKSKKFFLSPDGSQFQSRIAILQQMLKGSFSSDQVDEMRDLTSHEGWERSQYLPFNWIFKQTWTETGSDISILSEEGDLIKGYKFAEIYMEEKMKYDASDIANLKLLMEDNRRVRRLGRPVTQIQASAFSWQEGDSSLPKGWKMRKVGSKSAFLSPDGQQFLNRVTILQYMIQENYTEDRIDEMRELTSHEGWERSKLLPHNWIFRRAGNDKKRGCRDVSILSAEGYVLRSYKGAKDFMEETPGYNHIDLANIRSLELENAKAWRLSKSPEGAIPEDCYVPPTWQYKLSGKKTIFITTDGSLLTTRRLALQHLVTQGGSGQEVARMRDSLVLEGWLEDELLPHDWRFKPHKSGLHGAIVFLTAKGDRVTGVKAALALIESSQEYVEEDLLSFRTFDEIRQVKARSINYVWNEEDDTVPPGWKSRSKGPKWFFLSPDGQMFSSRRAGLQYMLKESFEIEDIDEMRMLTIKHEGWKISMDLPDGWIYKTGVKHFLMSSEGGCFDSYSEARKYLNSNDKYSEADIVNFDRMTEDTKCGMNVYKARTN